MHTIGTSLEHVCTPNRFDQVADLTTNSPLPQIQFDLHMECKGFLRDSKVIATVSVSMVPRVGHVIIMWPPYECSVSYCWPYNLCMCARVCMYVRYVVSHMMNICMCTYVCTYKHTTCTHTSIYAESSHCIVNVIFWYHWVDWPGGEGSCHSQVEDISVLWNASQREEVWVSIIWKHTQHSCARLQDRQDCPRLHKTLYWHLV